MARQIDVRAIYDTALWDGIVTGSSTGTVFSTTAWLDAACGTTGSERTLLGAYYAEELRAAVSFARTVRGPFSRAHTPVLTPYGGVLLPGGGVDGDADDRTFACVEALADAVARQNTAALVTHAPGLTDIRPFTWSGWRAQTRYTYLLNIAEPDAAWERFRQRARRKIRKAEVTLDIVRTDDAALVARLHDESWRGRGKKPPIGERAMTGLLDAVMKAGLAECMIARDADGNVAGFLALAIGTEAVYTWLYGSPAGAGDTGADSLLIWDAVCRHAATHRRMDLVGANIPGIVFFKKGFGGDLTPYTVTERMPRPGLRTLFGAYTCMRRMLKR